MKKVIEKLVEIEDKAHKIIENASTEKLRLEREKKDEVEKYRETLDQEREEKIEALRQEIDQELSPEIEEEYKKGNQILMDTENYFNENKEKIAQDVFDRIIGA